MMIIIINRQNIEVAEYLFAYHVHHSNFLFNLLLGFVSKSTNQLLTMNPSDFGIIIG